MKRIIMLIALLATLGGAGAVAQNAHADYQSVTCGESGDPGWGVQILNQQFSHSSNPSVWTVSWSQTCGTGKTEVAEIQASTDGGAHWADLTNGEGIFTAQDNNPDTRTHQFTSSGSCSNSIDYRAKVWANPNATHNASDWTSGNTSGGAWC